MTIALGSAQLFALAIDHNAFARHQLVDERLAAERKIDELAAAAARGVVDLAPPGALDRTSRRFVDVPPTAAASACGAGA